MESFKMAIMGTGKIAKKMATAINGLDEVEAYAVASRDLERAQQFADEWHFAKCYGSYEEMVKDPDIKLIYIATPHAMHYENAKLCIEYGKNVLIEISGGITEDNILDYAPLDVDIISLGSLTHATPSLNFSLDMD